MSYENGHGFVQDDAKALECYRQAAELNYSGAFFNLAVCYEGLHAFLPFFVLFFLYAPCSSPLFTGSYCAFHYHLQHADGFGGLPRDMDQALKYCK